MRMVRTIVLAGGLLGVFVACSTGDAVIGEVAPERPGVSFVSEDASVATPESGHRLYCASSQCPPGHTTCPSSDFLCDVDLLTDLNNCGECGNMCPRPGSGSSSYTCVEGRCVLNCLATQELDCDGVPDNGCEAKPSSNDNCGYCGNKCAADNPCIDRGIYDYACGCKPGELNCGGFLVPCVDPSYDDANCGACGNACPPQGDGTVEVPTNAYFGCFEGECGTLKCNAIFGNCDGNLTSNGCETPLTSEDNCGACGNKCPDGMKCRLDSYMKPQCMCPEGQTLCEGGCFGDLCFGTCHDLTSDTLNCGACASRCSVDVTNADEACVYGRCDWSCKAGWGDCNGNRDDGCETNISSDPKNCGGCGIVCDGIAGQACVDGRCMVEPCDELQDAGGPPR